MWRCDHFRTNEFVISGWRSLTLGHISETYHKTDRIGYAEMQNNSQFSVKLKHPQHVSTNLSVLVQSKHHAHFRCNPNKLFSFIKEAIHIWSLRRLASASPWGDCPSSWLLLWGDRGTCRWSFDTSLEWFFATPLLWLGVGLALLLQSFGPVVPVSRFWSPTKEFGCFV